MRLDKKSTKKIEKLLKTTILTNKEIGEKFGVSTATIATVRKREHRFSTKGKYPIRRPKEYYLYVHPPRGSRSGLSKLTEKKVTSMKKYYMKGWKIGRLAKKYEVNWTTVNLILQEKSWKHVKVNGFIPKEYGLPKGKRKKGLGEKEVKEMRYLHKKGRDYKYIAELTGFAYPTVRSICIGRTWRHV